MITGRTALFGVVGHPVGHSRSPEMHNRAFARLGIDAVYVALPVAPTGSLAPPAPRMARNTASESVVPTREP